MKLDIASAQLNSLHDNIIELKTPSLQVESCKQFKSLCSKPVACPKKCVESPLQETTTNDKNAEEDDEALQNRVEFHKMLSLLIRMGCGDKQIQERTSTRRIVSSLVLITK